MSTEILPKQDLIFLDESPCASIYIVPFAQIPKWLNQHLEVVNASVVLILKREKSGRPIHSSPLSYTSFKSSCLMNKRECNFHAHFALPNMEIVQMQLVRIIR